VPGERVTWQGIESGPLSLRIRESKRFWTGALVQAAWGVTFGHKWGESWRLSGRSVVNIASKCQYPALLDHRRTTPAEHNVIHRVVVFARRPGETTDRSR
jgi:hypothetical protein